MKVKYTKHVLEKLREKEAKTLGITKTKIIEALSNPTVIDRSIFPHRAVKEFSSTLSLCVIYKIDEGSTVVITFYPAGKGRYESKVLGRR